MRLPTRSFIEGAHSRLAGAVTVAAAALALALAWSGDIAATLSAERLAPDWMGPPPSWRDYLPGASGAVTAVAALAALPLRTTPPRTAVAMGGGALSVLVASLVLGSGDTGPYFGYPPGLTEALALALLATLVARRCRFRLVLAAGVLLACGYLSFEVRRGQFGTEWVSGYLIAALVAMLPGLYLRWRARQHEWRVDRVRREERLALARDLHDVVAHQVTGIVVQAQALGHVAGTDPARVLQALPAIERAGLEALAAMRQTVATLREDEAAPLEAPDITHALAALERPGAVGAARVEVTVRGAVAELPPEVGAAVLRMAQEALTNARRHAREALRVTVGVRAEPERVVVEVRDDGRAGAAVFGEGGGYGLIGMAERAKLLGGEFTAGPAPDGPGWRVRAALPLRRQGSSMEDRT